MTQAACQLILHYSTARLSWKTIKSLRRSSRRIPTSSSEESDPNDTAIISRHSPPQSPKEDNYDRCQSINTSAARNSNIGDGNDSEDEDEDVSPMEFEILQGWTILAFHSLYVSLNIEYAATFVIPFYFHFKMIILIITFVIPSWAIARGVRSMASSNNRRNDRRSLLESTSSFDEYGLSPAISMWFNYLIVPGVHAVHEFMDHDPKGWAILQFKMSMLAFLNYFVLPGVLMEEEEVNEVRFARGSDLWHEGAEVNDLTSNNRNEREIYDDVQSEDATSSQTPATDSLQREGGLHATTKTTLVRRETPSEKSSRLKSLKENLDNLDVLMEIVDNADSNTNAISLEQIDTNTADDKCNLEEIGQSRYDEGEDFTQFTPPDHQISTPVDNSAISPSQPSTTKRSSFDLLFSSAARNRVATSARKLHRFSKDHQIVGGLISSAKKGKSSENGDGISRYDTLITKLDFSNTEDDFAASDELNPHKQPSLESTSPQRPSSDKPKTRRKRRDRLSLGDHIREVVTGNPNIRIRDHLFDLDLPSPSSPSHAKHPRHFVSSRKGRRVSRGHRNPGGKLLEDFPSPEANDEDVNRKISFVATRRSTRLAKARAAQAYRR